MSRQQTPGTRQKPQEKRKKKAGKGRFFAIAAALAVLLGGVLWWHFRTPSTIQFRDHVLEVKKDVPKSHYLPENFRVDDGGRVTYDHLGIKARFGVDVSYYQENVDWEAAVQDGVEFAIVRAGFRGYESGVVQEDVRFEENMRGAQDAGLPVGVYFFSQATTPEEAEEEAEFVLDLLDGRELQYPVVFDWETIGRGKPARTDLMTGEEITDCAQAFCARIRKGGYEPMVYFNPELGYLGYDLSRLKGIPFWLARYESLPDFYYDYDLWQYSHTGTVDGIKGRVDMILDMKPEMRG